ncbi:unnamed protein product, partial [Leuciscus chuanchicus]
HTGSALWTSSDVERELEDRSIFTDRSDLDGTVVQVRARGNLDESSAAYNVHLQVPERGWDFGCYCSVIGQSQSKLPSDVLEGSVRN